MAGDWIKMRVDLRDDPAVYRLAELLDVDELHVIGALFCFWSWADKHAVDGHVDGATSRLVDRVSSTPGFADAMVKVGWIKISNDGIEIPNFERHNGESAKERGLKNARQARWRAKKDGDVDGRVDGAASTAASTEASTREEKSREEKKREEDSAPDGAGGKPPVDNFAGDQPPDGPPIEVTIDPLEKAKETAFVAGIPLLTTAGVRESGARSLMGRWVRDYGAFRVAAAVEACVKASPVADPSAWIGKVLSKNSKSKHDFSDVDYTKGAGPNGEYL